MENSDSVLVIFVQNLKETVTLITNVKKVSNVDQIIVLHHLDLMPTQIAVILIFAQLMNLVKWIKVTVIPMMNAKIICFVDQKIVLVHLGFYLQLIAVNQKVIEYILSYFSHYPNNLDFFLNY